MGTLSQQLTFREWLGLERGPIALAFTDIVGSTDLAVAMGDRDWIEEYAHYAICSHLALAPVQLASTSIALASPIKALWNPCSHLRYPL